MLRFTFFLAMAACVSADFDVFNVLNRGIDQVTNIGNDLLGVTRFFTISRVTNTILVTETETTSIFPSCFNEATASVPFCSPLAIGRSFNFGEKLIPTKPKEIEYTVAPGFARIDLPTEYLEEETFEFGELVFSSQDTKDCFTPKGRGLADFVTFYTSTTATTTVTTTETDTATTVSIIYGGCVPSDAVSTTWCFLG